jgi:recombinational DNA repair protein (RecF pathway)
MSAKRKTCSRCGVVKAAAEFKVRSRRCAQCRKEIYAQWVKDNPEKVAARKKRYREANLAKVVERERSYKAANPEKVKADIPRLSVHPVACNSFLPTYSTAFNPAADRSPSLCH